MFHEGSRSGAEEGGGGGGGGEEEAQVEEASAGEPGANGGPLAPAASPDTLP